MNWSQWAGQYPEEHPETHESLRAALGAIKDSGLDAMTEAVESDAAMAAKPHSTEFFLLYDR